MGEVNVDINLTNETDHTLVENTKKLDRAEIKRRMVSVLSRGVTLDRQQVPLPEDKYGEWVPNDKVEIYRMQSMGFEIDTKFAAQRALHEGQGTGGASIIGDTIFMVCDRVYKDVIDEIRRESYEAANRPRGGQQKEERDFANEASAIGLPSELKSRIEATTVEDIKNALNSKD